MTHRKLTRREMLRLTGGVGAAAALAACGQAAAPAAPAEQPAAEEPASEPEAPADAQPSGEKTAIRLWSHQNPSFIAANEATIAKYMEANPEVEIKYENFDYALVHPDDPDRHGRQ